MRTFSYLLLDVFTTRPLEGNQLAVFTDATGLSDGEMQALARETNLSETTFILPRAADVEAHDGVRVRIFTTQEELPFAGHPTLGTAMAIRNCLAQAGAAPKQVFLDLKVGRIPVTFTERDGRPFGEMRQRDPEFGVTHTREDIAGVCGLEVNDFDPDLPIQTASTGLAFGVVPLRTRAALTRLNYNARNAASYLEKSGTRFLYFVTRDVSGWSGEAAKARVHARMLFYNGEDPATGSAAGCCAAWMARYDVAASDEQVLIAQGLDMKRPSFLYVRGRRDGERVTDVRVGGHAVEVARGEVTL